jgi:serine/threonine protein kinase
MTLIGQFVLPKDAVLQAATELPAELRRAAGAEEGDFAISLRNSRSLSKIIDGTAANLIRQFEQPATVAVAVARFSRIHSADPEQALEDALPILRALINEGLLVSATSPEAAKITESLTAGSRVDAWEIVQCIQSLEDTEIYQVRDSAERLGALKIARPNHESAATMLARETRVLSSLTLAATPELLAKGHWQNRPYLVTEWFAGRESQQIAAELRHSGKPDSRSELLRLGAAILEAYAALHNAKVVHGDVHPRNLLVDATGTVRIIDFGMARAENDPVMEILAPRAGVGFFFEPEYATAALNRHKQPPPTYAGEQYAVAALLYLLLTGKHSQNFSLERHEMLRQISTGTMAPFAEQAIDPWPEVEVVLAKALSREPTARFASMPEFAYAWKSIQTPSPRLRLAESKALRKSVLSRAAIDGEWIKSGFQTAPTTSVNYGTTGLACALAQIAQSLDNGELLAAAEAWAAIARRQLNSETAFHNSSLDVTANTVGKTSLYHGPIGLYVTQALIARAQANLATQIEATNRFIQRLDRALETPDRIIDLTLGSAGSLLGAVFLLDALPKSESNHPAVEQYRTHLTNAGGQLLAQIWDTLGPFTPIGATNHELPNLGMAHGWAGLLYASLNWCAASETGLPDAIVDRLEQLAAQAQPAGAELQWRWPGGISMQGWCNGSAGFVFLWTQACQRLGEEKYLILAQRAAQTAWQNPSWIGNLCCGLAGQAYALLNLYRYTKDDIWLDRARQLAEQAAHASANRITANMSFEDKLELRPESLYKGEVGVAVLSADLENPLHSRMPLFERE